MRDVADIRVLLSARDAGAGLQARAFADLARRAGRPLAFSGLFEEPAASRVGGLVPSLPVDSARLEHAVGTALDTVQPDFVLAGLSGFGSGVDESVLAAAKMRGIPTGAIQDYWGYLGAAEPALRPDTYFVLDARARTLTEHRTGGAAHVLVTGSPKHEAYRDQIDGWRRIAADGDRPRATFFLQPRDVPEIAEHAEVFLRAAGRLPMPVRVTLRLHPADADASFYRRLADRVWPAADIALADAPVEPQLYEADVAVTCFSTVGLDHNYLQLFSADPIGSLAYLAIGEPIRAFMRAVIGSDVVPGAEAGMGVMIHSEQDLAGWLEDALTRDVERARYRRAVQRNLGAAGLMPSSCIADYIESLIGRLCRSRHS